MKPDDLPSYTKEKLEFLTRWAYRFGIFGTGALIYTMVLLLIDLVPIRIGGTLMMVWLMLAPIFAILTYMVMNRLEDSIWKSW